MREWCVFLDQSESEVQQNKYHSGVLSTIVKTALKKLPCLCLLAKKSLSLVEASPDKVHHEGFVLV